MQRQLYLWVGGVAGALGLPLLLLAVAALLDTIERVHTFNGPTPIEAELHSVGAILTLLVPMVALVGVVFGVVVGTMMYNAAENQRQADTKAS